MSRRVTERIKARELQNKQPAPVQAEAPAPVAKSAAKPKKK